jgi:hypothetical protein
MRVFDRATIWAGCLETEISTEQIGQVITAPGNVLPTVSAYTPTPTTYRLHVCFQYMTTPKKRKEKSLLSSSSFIPVKHDSA